MKYTTEQKTTIIENINNKLNDLLDKDFDTLSNNEMAFIKCVSLSSIMTMKKAGRDNDYIMTHVQKEASPENKEKKMNDEKVDDNKLSNALLICIKEKKINSIGKFLKTLTPEELKEHYGFKIIAE